MKVLVWAMVTFVLVGCGASDKQKDFPPLYKTRAEKAYVVFCHGCHEMRTVEVYGEEGNLKKSNKSATIANITKLLRPGGSHPLRFTERQLTTAELEAAAAYLLYLDRP